MKKKLPLDPEVERVPLQLTLDARSFSLLEGEAREEALFLCELCSTPALEGLWSWDGAPILHGIPVAELRPIADDARSVGLVGEPPGGFIGGIRIWSQYERIADHYGYEGAERDWITYYGALANFHRQSDRHFIVTADRRLLAACEEEKGFFRAHRHPIISVTRALEIAGLAMQAHGEIFYEAPQPGHTMTTTKSSMYLYLFCDLISSRRRLFECMRREGESQDEFRDTLREDLIRSLFTRVGDLLRARTRIALQGARRQDPETLEEVLYDLRGMIASAAGLFDTLAVLSQIAFSLEDLGKDGAVAVSLRRRSFRKALREAGGASLADEAARQAPLMHFLWSLRNPILHREGLSGYTLHAPPNRLSRIQLNDDQMRALEAMCGHRGEESSVWGLVTDSILEPALDAKEFASRFTLAMTMSLDQLAFSLADDLGALRRRTGWRDEQRKANRRFRWLTGLPSDRVTNTGLAYPGG